MRKYSQEEVETRIKGVIGESYEVIGLYKGSASKIKIRHKVCGGEFEQIVTNILKSGGNCPVCHKYITPKRVENYKRVLKEKLGEGYEVVGSFEGIVKNVRIRHEVCGYEWEIVGKSIYTLKECKGCRNLRRLQKLLGKGYEVKGGYRGGEVEVKHKNCGKVYKVEIEKALKKEIKVKCKMCEINKRKSVRAEKGIKDRQEWFKGRMKEKIGEGYELKSDYVRASDEVTLEHKVCGKEFNVRASSVLYQGKSCPYCVEKVTKEKDSKGVVDVINKKIAKYGLERYELVGEYKKATEDIKLRHKTCGGEFTTTLNKFVNGVLSKCPKCGEKMLTRVERYEYRVKQILEEGGYEILSSKIQRSQKILVEEIKTGKRKRVYPEELIKKGIKALEGEKW